MGKRSESMANVGEGAGITHCPWCFKKVYDEIDGQVCDDMLEVRACGHRSCSGCFFAENFEGVPSAPVCKVRNCGERAEKVARTVRKESQANGIVLCCLALFHLIFEDVCRAFPCISPSFPERVGV